MHHRSPVTHHHELASTSSSWELQARKAAASSRCRAAPVRLVRTGLLSMVRRVAAASQLVFCGEALCCRDTGRKWGSVLIWPLPGLWIWGYRPGKLAMLTQTHVFLVFLQSLSLVFHLIKNTSPIQKCCKTQRLMSTFCSFTVDWGRWLIWNYSSMFLEGQRLLVKNCWVHFTGKNSSSLCVKRFGISWVLRKE